MAGDWLKVEKGTPDKPEVEAMADFLLLDTDAVFGKLFRIWAWFDEHTTDGNAPCVSLALLDRKSGVNGFGAAMIKVGWLIDTEHGLTIPNFDRHNTETSKQRALTAKRVQKSKAKSNAKGNGKVTDDALPREEKRREEKNKELPSGSSLSPEATDVASRNRERFTEIWNSTKGVKAVRQLTDKRKRALSQRLKENINGVPWLESLAKASREKFPLAMTRGDPNGWQPDADWILRPGSLVAIWEGKYDWTRNQTPKMEIIPI